MLKNKVTISLNFLFLKDNYELSYFQHRRVSATALTMFNIRTINVILVYVDILYIYRISKSELVENKLACIIIFFISIKSI